MHTVIQPLKQLLNQGRLISLAKGQALEEDETAATRLYMVDKGYVKRYFISKDGLINTQSIYGPGYIFPLTSVLKSLFNQSLYHGAEQFYYEAMSEATLYWVEASEVKKHVKEEPLLYRDLLLVAGRRLRHNIQRSENFGLRNVYQKLAHQIFHLAQEFGDSPTTNVKISVPLTHQDLADILSVSRETVSRELTKLRSAGLISLDKRHLVVTSMPRLEQEAYQ